MTNHFSKAVSREASVVRYIAMLRKGYAIPSLEADSATRRWRMRRGTFFTANFPPFGVRPFEWMTNTVNDIKYRPITAALIIGSVGVKHAEMTSEDIKSSFGKSTWMNACGNEKRVKSREIQVTALAHLPAEISQPKAIVGTTMMSKLFA